MKTIKKILLINFYIILLTFLSPQQIMGKGADFTSDYIRIWGVVKYFSPFEISSPPKLDSAFFVDIKNIINNNSKKTYNRAIEALLNYAEQNNFTHQELESVTIRLNQIDSINAWIKSSESISTKNRKRIISLTHSKRDSCNAFICNGPENIGAFFTNDKKYISLYPTVEVRLLSLARYWNAINYFFPHKALLRTNWDAVLETFIPLLIDAKNDIEYHLTILRLITLIEDGHGSAISYPLEKYYGFHQIPCQVNFIDNQLIITSIFKSALDNPLKFGDKIIEINNQSFNQFYESDSCYIWGSNIKRKKNISARNFLKLKEEKISILKIERNDSIIIVNCPSIFSPSSSYADFVDFREPQDVLIGDDYIYLNLSKVDSSNFEELILSSKKPNIIVDVRKYPNWILNQIGDLFATKNTPFVTYNYPDVSLPGLFVQPDTGKLKPTRSTNKAEYSKIILMVDYTTISRGEFICMAFQSLPNVITVGDKTAGADGDISELVIPGGISTQFTGLGIKYPDGSPTQHTGVKIDKQYLKKGNEIKEGQDEELNYIINSIIKGG